MSFTDQLEIDVLNHVYRNTAYASPTTVYIALFTTATDDGGGGTEVSGGSYARQAITFGAPSPTPPSHMISNTAKISFPQATANWGTVTHHAIFDAATGGTMLNQGAVDTPRAINTDDTAVYEIGQLNVTLD